MAKRMDEVARKTKAAAKKTYDKVETKVLVAEGRKSFQRKARAVAKVSKKAVKTGAIAGALVAAAVVVREIRKRRALS
ncbi:MAG: hypothetical protein H7066_13805 [Cytophagaceae bacterium]|nr:hypothetical protein [Gemmatimonadaceae bacterium]